MKAEGKMTDFRLPRETGCLDHSLVWMPYCGLLGRQGQLFPSVSSAPEAGRITMC